MALSIFTNLCLILLLLLAGSLVPGEISLSINERKLGSSPGNGQTWYNLADGVTGLAQLSLCVAIPSPHQGETEGRERLRKPNTNRVI